MEMKAIFWLVFILWMLVGGWVGYGLEPNRRVGWYGTNIFLLILLFLLGWKQFGFIISG